MNLPRWSALVLAAPLALTLAAACDVEDPTQGDEQNQTDAKWTTSLIARGPDPFDVTGNERVTVAAAKDGTLYAVYDNAERHLTLATRAPGAKEWQAQVVKPDGQTGEHASIALDDDGTLHVVHYDRTAGGLAYAQRAAGATTWTHEMISLGAAENHMKRSADGTLHVVAQGWDQASATDSLIYAKRAGGKWSVETIVPSGHLTEPNFTLDDAGQPHAIVWQWADDTLDTGNLLLADRASGTWKTEAVGLAASYATDLLVEGDVTHLVYIAPNQKGTLYVNRTGTGAWSTPESVVAYGGWSPDLERDANGDLHVVLTVDKRLRHASRSTDGKWTSSKIADGAGGHILPFFVPGKDDEIVYTDWAYKTFNTAKLDR